VTATLSPSGRVVLLNPGPVNVSERVRQALLCADVCHREPELDALHGAVRDKLCRAFAPGGGYAAAVLAGSGTAAVEAMVRASVSPDHKLLVVNNGVYGDRMATMARRAGIGVVEVSADWFERPHCDEIDAALAADAAIDAVAMVHHETTTGLLNPVDEIGAIVRAHGRRFVVDSVSGLGGDEIDLAAAGVSLCAGTAGKNIQAFPGIAFVLIADEEIGRIGDTEPTSVYLHLPAYVGRDGEGLVPFTPAVQLLAACDVALDELLEESVAGRIARYRGLALLVRKALLEREMKLLVAEPWRSNCLTAIALPKGLSYERLHGGLRSRGYVIYAGQGDLRRDAFRVSTMGTITEAEVRGFVAALDETLASI
jgi:2-aminoethylphosphonate-pyruvate transaminase